MFLIPMLVVQGDGDFPRYAAVVGAAQGLTQFASLVVTGLLKHPEEK